MNNAIAPILFLFCVIVVLIYTLLHVYNRKSSVLPQLTIIPSPNSYLGARPDWVANPTNCMFFVMCYSRKPCKYSGGIIVTQYVQILVRDPNTLNGSLDLLHGPLYSKIVTVTHSKKYPSQGELIKVTGYYARQFVEWLSTNGYKVV